MANTEAESVDDMVDASNREVINGKWILVQLIPERYQMNNPVKSAVRNTPTVESTIPGEQNDAKGNHTYKLGYLGIMKL